MTTPTRLAATFAACLLAALLCTPDASAAVVGASSFRSYWHNFVDFWTSDFLRQGGIVITVLVCGAIGIFIITRGKWRK
jgi:hypothetical protein